MSKLALIEKLFQSIDQDCPSPDHDNVAHLIIHGNEVLGSHLVPGIEVEVDSSKDGIEMKMTIKQGVKIENPVQICFGMLPEKGVQNINMNVIAEQDSSVEVLAHCTFPNAVEVKHLMTSTVEVCKNASYSYFERHVHGDHGGIEVIPKTTVYIRENARFKTEFELLKGRVGLIDVSYEAHCDAYSVLDMFARINGRGADVIKMSEIGHLNGEYARGALVSHIALRDQSQAKIYNKLTASAAYARGHVDCKEIVQDEAIAHAIPIVEVNNPKAHVTHEAAIGSVDSKQLDTLMSRGLDEEDAVELIIQGLLQ